jgi:hypothetical protein
LVALRPLSECCPIDICNSRGMHGAKEREPYLTQARLPR